MTGSESPTSHPTPSTFGPLDRTGEPVQMLIITGMSGAGRSTAANVLEDAGWYVVDNLPPQMLPTLAEIASRARSALPKVATVIDVRGGTFFEDMGGALETLRSSGVNVKIMFLDASDESLVRRFESVRRPHPLQGTGRILDGIQAERSQVGEIRGAADLVVDTSNLNVHQLSAKVAELFSGEEGLQPLRLTVMSFGFKYGIPVDADHVVDVRFLPNPFWVPELRALTGRDEPVSTYVLEQPGAREFLLRYVHALEPVIEGYRRENRSYVTIAVGCTGGKHRSVAITHAIVNLLAQYMVKAHAAHRDLGRE